MVDRRLFGAAVLLLVSLTGHLSVQQSVPSRLLSLSEPTRVPNCESIEMFGICDPYVPGTNITLPRNSPVVVSSPWPQSPAEKAGICPGDRILSVNGVSTSENASSKVVSEFASDQPSSVHLTVSRGTDIREMDVPRVRESTLAELSHEKFTTAGRLPALAILVPIDEDPRELQQLDSFNERIDRRYGFKRVEGSSVPARTQPDQVRKLMELRQSTRFAGIRNFGPGPESYSAGFSALLLTNPDELWVDTVQPGSPAHQGGLLPGDHLIEVDGHALPNQDARQLRDTADLLFKSDEQHNMNLKVSRGASTITLQLQTKKRQEMPELNFDQITPRFRARAADDWILGIGALHAENPREAIVAIVEYPSPAFDAGLHVGDLLLAVNGKPLEQVSRDELTRLLSPTGPSQVVFDVSRLGRRRKFALVPVLYRTALAGLGRKATSFGPGPQNCPDS